jgi:hypothetical protein
MSTASPILLQRIQTVGENVNLWGGYINTNLETLERAAKGYEGYTVTGTATISWSNYSSSNSFAAMFTKLTGSPSAAYALTLPGVQTFQGVQNASGQAATIKNSGGAGITVPNSRKALLYGDATDIYEASPNWLNNYASTLTNNGDIVVKQTLETAIATASLPATAGTVLVTASDTTAGYLGQKITVAGDLALTTASPGANEDALITHTPYWNTPRSLAFANSPITALDRDVLLIDTSGGAITVNLPASGRVWVVDTTGNANANNITLTPAGASTITFGTIDTAYFGGAYRFNSTNWDLN